LKAEDVEEREGTVQNSGLQKRVEIGNRLLLAGNPQSARR
jgi:hypothetical protein